MQSRKWRKRRYLFVPYAEKEAAGAAGATWDWQRKAWWVPSDIDMQPFARWLEKREPSPPIAPSYEDIRASFIEAMRDIGLAVTGDHPILDGYPQRVAVSGKPPANRSGFYIGHLDGSLPSGRLIIYVTGESRAWCFRTRKQVSA
ncbi:MAG: DUF5710 domain-containing protein, partial [Parahaliea sp.]